MPWYMQPTKQAKVMNRLASKWFTKHASPTLVHSIMDMAQELLWAKVNNYYQNRGVQL